MSKSGKPSLSSFKQVFRFLIAAIFLIGIIPAPVLAAEDTIPPADITDLAAGNPTHDSITLTWTAPGDDSDNGTASLYDIRYAASIISDNTSWNNATIVQNPPTPSEEPEAPSEIAPTAPEEPAAQPSLAAPPKEPAAPLQISTWLIIVIVAVGIVIGIVIWRSVAGRKSS